MSKHLGPIEVECDAPPYPIVQASSRVGVRSPEDVRWTRLSRFFLDQQTEEHASPWCAPWRLLRASIRAVGKSCRCGLRLPQLRQVTFTLNGGTSLSYALGQCPRCLTVFWDEA